MEGCFSWSQQFAVLDTEQKSCEHGDAIIYRNLRTVPALPSTSTRSPSTNFWVACSQAMTTGIPYSLATIAAWESELPVSATTAEAMVNSGVQAGLVLGQTRISPAWSLSERCQQVIYIGSGQPLIAAKNIIKEIAGKEGDTVE